MNILSQMLLVTLSISWSNTQRNTKQNMCNADKDCDMKYITISNVEYTTICVATAVFMENRSCTIESCPTMSITPCGLCANILENTDCSSSSLFSIINSANNYPLTTTVPPSNWLSTTTIITNSTSNCLSHDSHHVAVYSLLGLIIIISFSLNIVLLCALVIRKNKTNKSLSSDNNTQETEATVELRDYRREDNLYEINQTEDIEHDTMYAVINKSQPPPLPPSYDIDHSTLYTTTIGEHGPVYDVATDYEEEGDKKVMKRPSQYEIPLSLHYPTDTTIH